MVIVPATSEMKMAKWRRSSVCMALPLLLMVLGEAVVDQASLYRFVNSLRRSSQLNDR
jgi:hypothetical protein